MLLQKLSFTYDDPCASRAVWLVGLTCMGVAAACEMGAYAFAAASILAPFGGLFPLRLNDIHPPGLT